MRKAVDERFHLSSGKGGGLVSREVCVDSSGRIVRYKLAYINPLLFTGDDGRVLG